MVSSTDQNEAEVGLQIPPSGALLTLLLYLIFQRDESYPRHPGSRWHGVGTSYISLRHLLCTLANWCFHMVCLLLPSPVIDFKTLTIFRKSSGLAIRHCIELGYHRSAAHCRPHADALTVEMSKRIFWVAYDLDRVAAFTLGRPFGIPDEMIDVEVCAALLWLLRSQ